jgi:hypothetical protein
MFALIREYLYKNIRSKKDIRFETKRIYKRNIRCVHDHGYDRDRVRDSFRATCPCPCPAWAWTCSTDADIQP